MKPDDTPIPDELPEGEGPSPDELREAETLARSLAGDPTAAPPPDLNAAAALLRYARGQTLSPDRAQALRADLANAFRPPKQRRQWWLWLLLPVAAGATAAAVLSPLGQRFSTSPPAPAPSPSLLAAQAAAARGDTRALDALDQQMRIYRQSMFQHLTRRKR